MLSEELRQKIDALDMPDWLLSLRMRWSHVFHKDPGDHPEWQLGVPVDYETLEKLEDYWRTNVRPYVDIIRHEDGHTTLMLWGIGRFYVPKGERHAG